MSEFQFLDIPENQSVDEQSIPYETQMLNKKVHYFCKHPGCDKSFRFKSEIERHVATHTNERPFPCKHADCNKAFKRLDALENHMRIHTKEAPFACDFTGCGKRFSTKASLRYHLLKHKDDKIYKCKFPGCKKAFITLFQLKQHEKAANYHKKIEALAAEKKPDVYEPLFTSDPQDSILMHFSTPQKMVELEKKPPTLTTFYEDPLENYSGMNVMSNVFKENELLKKRLELSEKLIFAVLQQRIPPDPSFYKFQSSSNLNQYQFGNNFFNVDG